MKKDSFVIYTEKEVFLRHLNDSQKARILESFFAYADERELPEMDAITSVVWEAFSLDFDRNNEKYERIKKARSEAGRQHRGNQYSPNKTEQMEQNGTNGTNGTDNVNVNVNVDVNDNVNVPSICKDNIIDDSGDKSPKRAKFQKPTLQELREFAFAENLMNVDCNRFFDYYESNGWKVGRNAMKDWRATLRNWNRTPQNTNNQQFNNKNYGNNQQNYRKEGLSDAEILEAVAGGFALFNASKQSDNQ